jgi:hypothetical protein
VVPLLSGLGCVGAPSCECSHTGRHLGLGAMTPQEQQVASLGVSTAATIGTTAAITAMTAGATAGMGAAIGAAAGPIGMAVGALVGIFAPQLFQPDYKKIAASNEANTISDQMLANLNSWKALSAAQKTTDVQAYYINNYNQLWNALVQYCSNQQLGSAGQNCIADRSPTGKYPWNVYYLEPIQNDPQVHQASVTQQAVMAVQGPITQIEAKTGLSGTALLAIAAGAIAVGLLL